MTSITTEPIGADPPSDTRPYIRADDIVAAIHRDCPTQPGTWFKIHQYPHRGQGYRALTGIYRRLKKLRAAAGADYELKALLIDGEPWLVARYNPKDTA